MPALSSSTTPARYWVRAVVILLASLCNWLPGTARAEPFAIKGASTAAQTLEAGQSGTVAAHQSRIVMGASPAVTLTGDGATFSNFGTLAQGGTGNAILAESGAGLVINNGSRTNAAAVIRTADNGVIQLKKAVANVIVNNYGTLVSENASAGGAQAIDFNKLSGPNTVNNYAGGVIRAVDADAVRPGENGIVANAGTIVSTSKTRRGGDAIDGQEHSGIRVTNARGGIIDGARHGITAGQARDAAAFTMSVTNEAGGIIRGNDGAGLNLDGAGAGQVVTVVNHGTIVGNGVTDDGDGIDVDGMVHITNTGIIRSANAYSKPADGIAYSEAISVGGGTIINSGTIEGLVADGNTNAVGRAISLVGNDIKGAAPGAREGIYGNMSVVNQNRGVIRGASESAIVAVGATNDFTITIDNQAGATISGAGKDQAAVRSTSNSTTITNAGTIDGAASNKAIELGHAHNTLIVKGGSAVIRGAIDGGPGGGNTMVVDAGAGKQFTYAGTIARFDTLDVKSGNARLSGQLSFTNKTVVSGGSLTLVGPRTVAPGSALVLAGGALHVEAAGSAGITFASLALDDDATLDAGQSVVSFERLGQVAPGKTLTLTGSMRILGDQRQQDAFQALLQATRLGPAGMMVSFDGRYTQVAPAAARLARAE